MNEHAARAASKKPRKLSEREVKMNEVNMLFQSLGISLEKQRLGKIWAAKYRECPRCGAKPGKPCLNLTQVKMKGLQGGRTINVKENKWPHEQRIDLDMLLLTLRARMR